MQSVTFLITCIEEVILAETRTCNFAIENFDVLVSCAGLSRRNLLFCIIGTVSVNPVICREQIKSETQDIYIVIHNSFQFS